MTHEEFTGVTFNDLDPSGIVNEIGDKTRQFCLVSTQFPICNCSVLRTAENLEIGNWAETKLSCLVANSVYTTDTEKTSRFGDVK